MSEHRFSVMVVYPDGSEAVLSVKNVTEWKTKKTAIKHMKDVQNQSWFKEQQCTAYIENV